MPLPKPAKVSLAAVRDVLRTLAATNRAGARTASRHDDPAAESYSPLKGPHLNNGAIKRSLPRFWGPGKSNSIAIRNDFIAGCNGVIEHCNASIAFHRDYFPRDS